MPVSTVARIRAFIGAAGLQESVQRAWIARLAGATLVLAVAGFAVLGLSRLVVGVETARLLAAPLLFGGFVAAIATFCLAVGVSVQRRRS